MEHFEDQLDMFEERSSKKQKPEIKEKKSTAQIVALTNLGDCVFKPRPFSVVRINPTTIYILNE